jgi:hypothetical protein
MTSERDFDRLARAWLELGPDEAPDRVVAAVLQAAETTPQVRRPFRWPLWRSFPMNRLPVAVGAAAILVAAIGGAVLLDRDSQSGVGGPPVATPSATPPTSAAPTIAATTAPTKALGSTPALPAPAALQGRWRAEIAPGVAILTLTATTFTINWLGFDSGRIEVEGDEITFTGTPNPQCPGPDGGTYRWSIEGDKLHLEPVGTDPCVFQADFLANRTYTRND